MTSTQTIERRRVGKRDRELIVRYFKAAPSDEEPSAYARRRMEMKYSEAEIDRVMLDHVDLQERVIAACKIHAAGFTSFIREVESDTLADLAEAV